MIVDLVLQTEEGDEGNRSLMLNYRESRSCLLGAKGQKERELNRWLE
jgi:hypothetical protein